MKLKDLIGKELLFFDGAMGTQLQSKGLSPGELPESWNISHPEVIKDIHQAYLNQGCHIIKTNTFGANPLKIKDTRYEAKELITQGIYLAKEAINQRSKAFIALDIGPTGKLLEPLGTLTFDQAYESFSTMVKIGVENGAGAILIETFTDTYELKAAILAAKDHSNLPIFASLMVDEEGKLLTGGDIPTVVSLCEGLGVDALGLNCGFGPVQMTPFIQEMIHYSSVPVFANPNAGLPVIKDGETTFSLSPSGFSKDMKAIIEMGPWLLGGCCGTTPAHLGAFIEEFKNYQPKPVIEKNIAMASSYANWIQLGEKPLIIGEKINPTGNKALSKALRDNNFSYITSLALEEKKAGAHILDVNVGLPGIEEVVFLKTSIRKIQQVMDSPLMIDTSNISAMEKALRYYNGKALVNSVSGKEESMDQVFPLIKKYGGLVVALLLDDDGIPKTAKDRVSIAKKILSRGKDFGLSKKDFLFDPLTMTVSTNKKAPKITLDTLSLLKEEGLNTVMGVSNVSFGLPSRGHLNSTFFALALNHGLDGAIINPFDSGMIRTYDAYLALFNMDENFRSYISTYEHEKKEVQENKEVTLESLIIDGLKEEIPAISKNLLSKEEPLQVINNHVIPALSKVGDHYERGEIFLPQLLMSAEAATLAFEEIKKEMPAHIQQQKGPIVLATVKGDIHDIGKNIVKVLLESYGYTIIDLGKDVPPQVIVDTVKKEGIAMVGLSALMTTTLSSMEETISLLKSEGLSPHIVVGGAVLTKSYASKIGASFYAKDGMATVKEAEKIFN